MAPTEELQLNTEVTVEEPKHEPMERSKERQGHAHGKKKKTIQIATIVPKINFLVEATVNIKGQRQEIGFIIEAKTKEQAMIDFDKRLKKEYSGIRNINHKTAREALDTDVEYVKSKEENKPTSLVKVEIEEPEESSINELLQDMSDNASTGILNELTLWKVVITPGRKPRQRDFNSNYVYAIGDTEQEAKNFILSRLDSPIPIKDKWIRMYKVSAKDIITKDPRFKEFMEVFLEEPAGVQIQKLEQAEKEVDDMLKEINKKERLTNGRTEMYSNFKGFSIDHYEDGYIKSIELTGVNIFDRAKLKKFILKPGDYPDFTIMDMSKLDAIGHVCYILKMQRKTVPDFMDDIDDIVIIDAETEEVDVFNYKTALKEKKV